MSSYVVQINNNGAIKYQQDIYGMVDLNEAPRLYPTSSRAELSAKGLRKLLPSAIISVIEVKLSLET